MDDLLMTMRGPARVLLASGDESLAEGIRATFARLAPPRTRRLTTLMTLDRGVGENRIEVVVARTLSELMSTDVPGFHAAVVDRSLAGACGFESLAFLRGAARGLPIAMVAPPEEAAVAEEAIRAGASDFFVLNADTVACLPALLEKTLVQARVRAEHDRLQLELGRSLVELALKNRQLEEMIHQLETQARTDVLTQLANRRWLSIMLEGAWADAVRHDLPLAFAMIDLDGFKALNDAAGHDRGDDLLRLVGRVLRANSRDVDICARLGGDEFCVLMPHTRPIDAEAVARRIFAAFAEAIAARTDDPVRVSMSMGLAHVDLSRPVNADDLVRHADQALYAAKAHGKGRIMVRIAEGRMVAVGATSLRSAS